MFGKFCKFCNGDEKIVWKDDMNYAYVYNDGQMVVTVKDNTIHFRVKYCPICGRKFKEQKIKRR